MCGVCVVCVVCVWCVCGVCGCMCADINVCVCVCCVCGLCMFVRLPTKFGVSGPTVTEHQDAKPSKFYNSQARGVLEPAYLPTEQHSEPTTMTATEGAQPVEDLPEEVNSIRKRQRHKHAHRWQ